MKKLIVAALAMLAITSCVKNDGPNQTWERTLDAVAVTENTSTGTEFEDQLEVTIIQSDVTSRTLSFNLTGIQFIQMMPSVNITIRNVPFTLYDDKGDTTDPLYNSWELYAAEIVPQVGGVDREDYTLRNLRGNFSDNGLKLEFDVNVMGAIFHSVIDTSAKMEE